MQKIVSQGREGSGSGENNLQILPDQNLSLTEFKTSLFFRDFLFSAP